MRHFLKITALKGALVTASLKVPTPDMALPWAGVRAGPGARAGVGPRGEKSPAVRPHLHLSL